VNPPHPAAGTLASHFFAPHFFAITAFDRQEEGIRKQAKK
jgi:hypothetical protein